jgi:hypothetical protein
MPNFHVPASELTQNDEEERTPVNVTRQLPGFMEDREKESVHILQKAGMMDILVRLNPT